STPTARSRLKSGRQPHWNTIRAGHDHLGYQRQPDQKQGRWILRRRRGGHYSIEPIGIADDDRGLEADGVSVLNFDQARAKAVELSSNSAPSAGRLTVSRAIADYVDFLKAQGKDTRVTESAAVNYILPVLAAQ